MTLAVLSADIPSRDVIVITDFWTLCFTLYKLVPADLAQSDIIIFLLLAGTQALYRPFRMENRNDLCIIYDERVKELGERVLFDFYYGFFEKIIKI